MGGTSPVGVFGKRRIIEKEVPIQKQALNIGL